MRRFKDFKQKTEVYELGRVLLHNCFIKACHTGALHLLHECHAGQQKCYGVASAHVYCGANSEPRNNQSDMSHHQIQRLFSLLVLTLAFTSGFIIMSIELLGGRILAPYFGSSIYVWGSIITIFMLSLAIGYLTGGRLSMNQPSLKRYGLFYIGAALALLPTIFFGEYMMDAVFLRLEDPRYGSLVASMFLFFVPTVILGMIAPYSVRLLVESAHESGRIAGGLYFVSTLGSALGTLATSFYLVLWFEVNQILLTMVAVLLFAGLVAIASNLYLTPARRGSEE